MGLVLGKGFAEMLEFMVALFCELTLTLVLPVGNSTEKVEVSEKEKVTVYSGEGLRVGSEVGVDEELNVWFGVIEGRQLGDCCVEGLAVSIAETDTLELMLGSAVHSVTVELALGVRVSDAIELIVKKGVIDCT